MMIGLPEVLVVLVYALPIVVFLWLIRSHIRTVSRVNALEQAVRDIKKRPEAR